MKDKIYSGTNTKRDSLLKKASDFKLDQKYSEGIEEKRIEFTKRFPLEKIKDMSIEDYVIGKQSKKSFSYWLEFGLKDVIFNIPGNASKFGLYYSGGSYCIGAGKNKRKLAEYEAINYFEKIKNEITSSFDKVNRGDVINIPDNSLINNNVLQKILVIYFPQKFMSITSKEILVELISILFDEKKYVELIDTSPIFLNYICNKSLREMSIFKDWTYEKIGAFIWDTHKNNLSGIVRFLEGTPDEVKVVYAYLKESFSHRKIQLEILRQDAPARGGGFLSMQILHKYEIFEEKKGILLKKSFNEEYSEAKGKYKDALDLLKKFCPEFSNEIISDIRTSYKGDGVHEAAVFVTKNDFKSPLNRILYGPPGTGKTYNTINKALEIIVEKEKDELELRLIIEEKEEKIKISGLKEIIKENSPSKKQRQTLQEVFKHFKEKGQIEFITFHQSYSYEDFVEGIKPIPPKEDENQSEEMVFRTQPGVFKRICDEAIIENFLEDYSGKKFYRIALGRKNENPTERLKYCYEKNLIGLGYIGYKKDLSNYKNEKEIKENANVDPTGYKMLNYLVNGMKDGDIVFVTEGQNIVAICEINGNYSFSENPDEIMIGYEHQRAVKWIKKDINLSVKKLFSYKTVPGNSLSPIIFEKKDVVSNFVLIIDEINRGNISKIFGELITLIEDDKRLGKENEMTVTLPYSKDSFGVPANLHIVGTMNTADRSIALMDMALRRRFTFEEMMPRTDLLNFKVNGIEIDKLLEKINERIEFLYDRDHTIGHAYFIKLKNNPDYKELCSIFANKIIPLLQEYFYEDWEKIQIVLGDHIKQYKKEEKDECKEWDDEINKTRFIQSKISVETDVIGFNHNDFENSTVYRINPKLIENDMPEESFRKISEPAKKSAEEQDSKTKQ